MAGWALGDPARAGQRRRPCSLRHLLRALERRSPPDTRAYSGRWGFDPDDALYLMAPLAWLGWLAPILVGAAMGATAMMVITGLRLRRLTLQQA